MEIRLRAAILTSPSGTKLARSLLSSMSQGSVLLGSDSERTSTQSYNGAGLLTWSMLFEFGAQSNRILPQDPSETQDLDYLSRNDRFAQYATGFSRLVRAAISEPIVIV